MPTSSSPIISYEPPADAIRQAVLARRVHLPPATAAIVASLAFGPTADTRLTISTVVQAGVR